MSWWSAIPDRREPHRPNRCCGRPKRDRCRRLPGELDVTASVSIVGGWQGHVVIRTRYRAACDPTAAMIGVNAAAVKPDDVLDGMGEIANIVTGNVKSLLAQPSWVALPHVVISPTGIGWPQAVPVMILPVLFGDHQVLIEVIESTATAQPS
ncbi:chemotaxis protein CheX [Dactylosporangium vinaceum]|uniref:chemotaxis protein CheX n=1 Tax=Dactylosporangium vinaceum TaxID=53362 RepID=UPI001FE29E22|nr:chemotaxis protein CheX [Dactylosporangium vinaceum]